MNRAQVTLGCDPELFIEDANGQVVGSEKVIPEAGLSNDIYHPKGIIRDGVQVELNPASSSCRESVGAYICSLIQQLNASLQATGHSISFKSVVEVSKEEMDSLSEKSKQLGCAPSLNIYDSKATIKVAEDYRVRCGGGHLHFGFLTGEQRYRTKEMVRCLDALLGNTCVLIDRNPAMVERRKVYGRAGEHRLPSHGLEYRVLSNFWLRSYEMWSFVSGLGRMAIGGALDRVAYKQIDSMLDSSKVAKAINENDYDLAWENWQVVKEWLKANVASSEWDGTWTLCPEKFADFEYFVKKGLDHWFPRPPVQEWGQRYSTGVVGHGWERFLSGTVKPQRLKEMSSGL